MHKNKYKILHVEDEEDTRSLVSALLEANGYQVVSAKSYEMARTMYASHIPDLVILDLGLPDKDGSVLLEEIRARDLAPVIVLSARDEEREKVRLLDMGANDYITKPFGQSELAARVRNALRNRRHDTENGYLPGGKFRAGELVIDYGARQVCVANQEIKLTKTEYNIAAFLSENCGRMMTYAAIIKAVWREYPDAGNIKKLQVNMANLRKKLGASQAGAGFISNEPGVGYRMQG